jgi:RNA polymerase sigma-70 factor (ECF subfamily)
VTPTDHERFEALYRREYPAVLRYARRRTDAAGAEEIAAETFTIAWRRLDDVPADALPWLLVCARNLVANAHRSRQRARATTERTVLAGPAATRDVADSVVERDVVLRAFAQLRPDEREVLALIAWDGLSHADGARVMGTSRLAFAMRASRARRRLAAVLSEPEPGAALTRRPLEHS